MENKVPMEFDMAPAVPRGRQDIKEAIQQAIEQHKTEIHKILTDFGVPLVKCDDCLISGDLPSHGPYQPVKPEMQTTAYDAKSRAARMAELKKWLAQGADPSEELSNAVVADDMDRVRYLVGHGAHVNAADGEGYPTLVSAARFGFTEVATYLVAHKADPNLPDRTGWTPLMFAAWNDQPGKAKIVLGAGRRRDSSHND